MNKDTLKEKLQDDFMDFWDSKKDILGLGSYSDVVTDWWLNEIENLLEQERNEERGRILAFVNKKYSIHQEIERTHTSYPKDWHEGNRNALADVEQFIKNTTQEDVTNETNV